MTGFAGKRYLVAGGTGDVGSAIVGVLLSRGAQVLVPARDAAKAERLRAEVGGERLTIIPGDIGSVTGAESVAAQIEMPLSGVVASLGGWWQGPPLTAVSPADWDAILAGNLTSHFAAARAFVPLIDVRGGSYVQILGAAAEFRSPGRASFQSQLQPSP
jgi:NAD(P)-dependent dehydrogenase (short-subunit alcohol dehydrogenase family)